MLLSVKFKRNSARSQRCVLRIGFILTLKWSGRELGPPVQQPRDVVCGKVIDWEGKSLLLVDNVFFFGHFMHL